MAATRLLMRKLRDVLRLKYECGLPQRAIAQACGMGLGTVTIYLQRAATAGLTWPCECYATVKANFQRLLPEIVGPTG